MFRKRLGDDAAQKTARQFSNGIDGLFKLFY